MKKIHTPDDLWPWLDRLGDDQSSYLLEQFIPGRVFHVDSVVSERRILFAEAHAYGAPPSTFRTVEASSRRAHFPRDAAETLQLKELNRKLMQVPDWFRGVTHAEFLKAHATGKIYFLKSPRALAALTLLTSSRLRPASILARMGQARSRCREDSLRIAACGAKTTRA